MEITEFSPQEQTKSKWHSITIADGLFVLVLIGAALLRLVNLDNIPLSDKEAEMAWAVWRFWQPGFAQLSVGSPAYFSITAVLVQILGISDVTVRLVPALFGTALVALPWFIRQRLGQSGALIAVALLAVSPLNVALSRTVSGDAIALFAIGLLLVAVIRFGDSTNMKWAYTISAAIGLGMASSALFYSGLVTLAAALFLQQRLGISLFTNNEWPTLDKTEARNAGIVGLVVLIASGSFVFWYPEGLGAVARILGDWFTQFGVGSGTAEPFLAVIRYEPALVIIGLVALVWAVWQSETFPLTFVYWGCALILLMLVQAGLMHNAILFTLPGYLLIGILFSYVFSFRTLPLTWGVTIGLLVIFGLLIVNTGRFLKVVTYDSDNLQFLLMITIGLVLATLGLLFVSTYDVTAVLQGTLFAFCLFFIFVGWGNSWWLGHEAANDPRERWVTSGTSDDMRITLNLLTTISRQITNEDGGLDIASSVDTPALRWYLRDFYNAKIGDALPANATNDVLITPLDTSVSLGDQYTGTDLELAHRGVLVAPEQTYSSTTTALLGQGFDVLRWWMFHDSRDQAQDERIIVWVRADLGQGE